MVPVGGRVDVLAGVGVVPDAPDHLGLLDHVAHEAAEVDEGVWLDGGEYDDGCGPAEEQAGQGRRRPIREASAAGVLPVEQAQGVDEVGHDECAVDRHQGDLGGDAEADDDTGGEGVAGPALPGHAGEEVDGGDCAGGHDGVDGEEVAELDV